MTNTFPIIKDDDMKFHVKKSDVENYCDWEEDVQLISLDEYTRRVFRELQYQHIRQDGFDLGDFFDNDDEFNRWFDSIVSNMYIEKLKVYLENK